SIFKNSNHYLYVVIYLLLFCFISNTAYAIETKRKIATKEKGVILVLSSYNPDVKRMSNFISIFESTILHESSEYEIFIEDLNFKGMDESNLWKINFKRIIDNYKNKNLKAILLLGQESWATFLSLGEYNTKIPFFGCIASENGMYIKDTPLVKYPEMVDFTLIADSIGNAGGALNKYDVKKNIQLIRTIYQNVRNIALISDNTYGGIALQSLFISEMEKESDLSYTLLDARDGVDVVEDKISHLPENSAVILGTWRTGDKGQYLMFSSLEKIISLTDKPIFTISGVGFETLAIGGVIPVYDNHSKEIAKQIIDFYNGDSTAVKFIPPLNEYRFDSGKLKKYGIKNYQLPSGSIITDRIEAQLLTYRSYIYAGSIAFLILVAITIFILFLYIRNKRLKDSLKNRECELIAAKERAEESDILKTAFLANMSHEIRTPLNAIIGFSTMMCDEETSAEDRVEYSSIIKSNNEMLLTLVTDILDISRLQSTNIKFINEDTDIVSLMHNVITTTKHKNTLGIKTILDTELSSYIINIDEKRLTQVLINLMTNAYKFTKEGSITLSLRVTDNICTFAVADTGIGVPLEFQDKIFDRFEKVNEFAQGTGLGLAICRQIITKFGGDISMDSSYTKGSKFVFTIPAKNVKTNINL
ncbi:MAG: HAMP domain-containing sensor histidine kinase, partial [Rikenellaceae bacterium]